MVDVKMVAYCFKVALTATSENNDISDDSKRVALSTLLTTVQLLGVKMRQAGASDTVIKQYISGCMVGGDNE